MAIIGNICGEREKRDSKEWKEEKRMKMPTQSLIWSLCYQPGNS
jgi:hypothetical protein